MLLKPTDDNLIPGAHLFTAGHWRDLSIVYGGVLIKTARGRVYFTDPKGQTTFCSRRNVVAVTSPGKDAAHDPDVARVQGLNRRHLERLADLRRRYETELAEMFIA